MRYEDRLVNATPEGVTLAVTLAGLPSRMIAGFLDLLIKAVVVGGIMLVLNAILGGGLAVYIIVPFAGLMLVGYDIFFETRAGGRTPGKRACHLRVTRSSGAPVDAPASAVRNLLRLVDGLPLSYLPTVVSILVTRRNQRLGDLAADTIVVREHGRVSPPATATATEATDDDWDVSGVAPADVALVRSYLERRSALDAQAATRLAADLAGRLRPVVAGAEEPDDVRFLERLVAIKRSRA